MLTVILTGGQSRRMGRDKAALPVGDRTLSLVLADRYAALGPVCFAVDRPGRFDTGPYEELTDRWPGQGPVNGILSAFLAHPEEDVIFLTATDMPGGTVEAVRRLLERLGDHDACLYGGEPLFALYRRSCLAPAARYLEEGRCSFYGLLERLDVLTMPRGDEALFTNLNTPADWERFKAGGK